MSQAKFSRQRKHDYVYIAHITRQGRAIWYRPSVTKAKNADNIAFKLRVSSNGLTGPVSVVILGDKPQKPLPFDSLAIRKKSDIASDFVRFSKRLDECGYFENLSDEDTTLFLDCQRLELVFKTGEKFGLTEAGKVFLDSCTGPTLKTAPGFLFAI